MSDPVFRLGGDIRSRIGIALRSQKARKSGNWLELVGCTQKQLATWLEKKFKPGMCWERRGEWHIDHKRPVILFDLTDPVQQRACFHYKNLQPLWAHENLAKSDNYADETGQTEMRLTA